MSSSVIQFEKEKRKLQFEASKVTKLRNSFSSWNYFILFTNILLFWDQKGKIFFLKISERLNKPIWRKDFRNPFQNKKKSKINFIKMLSDLYEIYQFFINKNGNLGRFELPDLGCKNDLLFICHALPTKL